MATWQLQTAKAKLSELLRAVREEGPQTISVRGKEEFVVAPVEMLENAKAPPRPAPKTWDELYESVRGLGDNLVLPPREPEPPRPPLFEDDEEE